MKNIKEVNGIKAGEIAPKNNWDKTHFTHF